MSDLTVSFSVGDRVSPRMLRNYEGTIKRINVESYRMIPGMSSRPEYTFYHVRWKFTGHQIDERINGMESFDDIHFAHELKHMEENLGRTENTY